MSIEPAFHLSVRPFGSDPLAVTIHVIRVHFPRTPHYGTKGQLLEPNPIFTLAEVLAEVERVASGLGMPTGKPLSRPVVDGRIVPQEKVA